MKMPSNSGARQVLFSIPPFLLSLYFVQGLFPRLPSAVINEAQCLLISRPLRKKRPVSALVGKTALALACHPSPALIRDSHLSDMFRFTQIFIQHAVDLAKCGKKDSARNWMRFFRSSCVLEVLADSGHGVEALRRDLNELAVMCHPEDAPSFETDLAAIRGCLNEILFHVAKTNLSNPAAIAGRSPRG